VKNFFWITVLSGAIGCVHTFDLKAAREECHFHEGVSQCCGVHNGKKYCYLPDQEMCIEHRGVERCCSVKNGVKKCYVDDDDDDDNDDDDERRYEGRAKNQSEEYIDLSNDMVYPPADFEPEWIDLSGDMVEPPADSYEVVRPAPTPQRDIYVQGPRAQQQRPYVRPERM